ncbi:response regulator receiver domain protein (CheY-like) [Sulfurimonas denitrificans DSM 1251]|uniref:Response regulator receiver domain protein (CheY-like) n=1 Tax=Sulfurimonas denitrificans (strain ATCC 33889 / DSM 1251) TaxID=326298 RepID=Q30RY3_SULDN|nr:response regulator [Sulfurimonas denitrificans]ABB44248.1 response regulator receiver domain protein (CheY-like) [Sulfurimonas denitrificans DSM 1251]MDD3443502.1 response regulator [Sulfurimonas denitrificans]
MLKKVVFVDDSKAVLASVELAVEELVANGSISFDTYSNPAEFLEKVTSGSVDYDLLFTDINMPQMSGLELSKKLKDIASIRQKPILALTTENSTEIKQTGKDIGIAGWVVKPFSNDKIVLAIKKVLGI